VQAVGGSDDVTGLLVEVCGEFVQLPDQASQILLAAPKRGAERLGDVLYLAEPAAVEHQRQRRQRLLGARVGTAMRQRNEGTVTQLALRRVVFSWGQLRGGRNP